MNDDIDHEHARQDLAAAKTGDGIDLAILASRHGPQGKRRAGFKPIPGMSRSGALTPQDRSRFERMEADGLIEIDRNGRGEWLGYRVTSEVAIL